MSDPDQFTLIIDSSGTQKQYFKDLYRYRELLYFFTWRDIIVRYKQTVLGILWALFRPILNMAVFALVFGKIANLSSDGVNYPLFVLTAMLPWLLFAGCAIDTSNTLVSNSSMISKVYFPRILLPISNILVNFSDFFVTLILMFFILLFSDKLLSWTLLLLPVFIFLTLILCLGTSLWLSAINVRFRDLRFLVPFLIQFGLFISPVGYGSFLVPEPWRVIYFLNPMAGIIEGFRWCCLGIYHSDIPLALLISCSINLLLLVTGFKYFRKMERVFADII